MYCLPLVDSTNPELSKLLVHIPRRIHRARIVTFSLCISFLRQFFCARLSHILCILYLKQFASVVVTALFGIPVLSFAPWAAFR